MNSPDPGANNQNRESHGRLIFIFLLALPLTVLAIILGLVGREKAREEAENKDRKDEVQEAMDAARLSNQMRQNLGLGARIEADIPAGGSRAGAEALRGSTVADFALKDALDEYMAPAQLAGFFRTWEEELGKGRNAQKIWAECWDQSTSNGRRRHIMKQRDLAASLIILIDQSFRTGKEVDATALESEVFGQDLQPPEIMMLAALRALASLETGLSGITTETAGEEFAEISKSLAVWESALKIASEGSYSYYYKNSSPFDSEEAKAFYRKQFETYQAHLQRYLAAVAKFEAAKQESDMTEVKTAVKDVMRVLAFPFLTWSASDDRKIQARFVKVEGETVVIEKDDGKQYTVPFANLAPTSVELAKRLEHVASSVPTVRVHPR